MNSTISVVSPATVTALTTLERVKLELGITGTATDALLSAKIDEATSDIAVRVRPSLRRETVTESFWRDRDGVFAETIILRRYPVVSVTSVTLDNVVVDPAEYRLDGARGFLYRLSTSGYPRHWYWSTGFAVTYVAGYLLPGQDGRDLPPSIEAAAIELVTSYWFARGRDPLLKSETSADVGSFSYWDGSVGAGGALPSSVMSKIGPYCVGGYV